VKNVYFGANNIDLTGMGGHGLFTRKIIGK